MRHAEVLRNIDWALYLRYNHFNKSVRRRDGRLIPYHGCAIALKGTLDLEASLTLGKDRLKGAPCGNLLRVDEGGSVHVSGGFCVYYAGDIIVFKGGRLEIGSGFANTNLRIRCTESIRIGDRVAISHDVTIMDSDAHELIPAGRPKIQPVTIGDDVWIGSRVLVLKGVTIGDGAVVGAGSVVTSDVPAHSLAAGNPARVLRDGISWT